MLCFPSTVGGMRKWQYAIKDVIWTLVLNARGKDGGKREEESCGADTGMQRCSWTRWFLLVGVRTVGQLRGTLAYASKKRKDFRFYCFLLETTELFSRPFLSYSPMGRHRCELVIVCQSNA